VNIALIALATDQTPIAPPLTLAYIAAALEQQRHIVRLYDLALSPHSDSDQPARLLRSFRPKAAVIAGGGQGLPATVAAELASQHTLVLPLYCVRSDTRPVQACSDVMAWLQRQGLGRDERSVIQRRAQAESEGIDTLPFPARHLVRLECYGLQAHGGELMTTLLLGQPAPNGPGYELRAPSAIANELRAVAREHGVRHYRLCGAPITADRNWTSAVLQALTQANLEIAWDAAVQPSLLDPELLPQLRTAGCEALRFDFNAPEVLESASLRASLRQIVARTRQHGIYAHAELTLEHPYESIPQLVDVAATFGLDDVRFMASTARQPRQEATNVEKMAQRLYSAGRSRQHFIEKYGSGLGAVLWQMRQSRFVSHFLGKYEGAKPAEKAEDMMSAA
jgi:hypothetical protein